MTIRIELTCPRHPTYKGERVPKSCDTCFDIWDTVYDVEHNITAVKGATILAVNGKITAIGGRKV